MAVHTALQDLAELIRYQAAVRPEQVAITFEGRSTTYGQLDRRRMGLPMGCGRSTPLPRCAWHHSARTRTCFSSSYSGLQRHVTWWRR